MNIDYMAISDEKIAVTDENGKIIIRNGDLKMIEDVLTMENRIELIENKMQEERVLIKEEEEGLKQLKKFKKILLGCTVVLLIFAGVCESAILIPMSEFFSTGTMLVDHAGLWIFSLIYPTLSLTSTERTIKKVVKKIERLKDFVTQLEELRNQHVEKLNTIKARNANEINKEKKEKINSPITLDNSTLENEMKREFENMYHEESSDKAKVLQLSK